MKKNMLLFDSSTLISLAMTCSCAWLTKLKKDYEGRFVIPLSVKREVIDKSQQILRFKYEGYRLQKLIDAGVFELMDDTPYQKDAQYFSQLANSTYRTDVRDVKIIHPGEILLLVIAHKHDIDDAVVIDERTTRLLVEAPDKIPQFMESKLRMKVHTDESKLKLLKKELTSVRILRSADLALAAYLKGYIDGTAETLNALLWALKFAGCAISKKEIDDYSKRYI